MKAKLEFDLDDHSDRLEHNRALNANIAFRVIFDMLEVLRSNRKYKDLDDEEAKLNEQIENNFYSILSDYDIDIENFR